MSVLALIPHYQTHQWLDQCIESILKQTVSPTNILVVDDCSDTLPIHSMSKYPQVTFMRTATNGGPFRIHQAVFENTCHQRIMLQDSDDWSDHNRLKALNTAMESNDLDMVGCQLEYYYEYESGEKRPILPSNPREQMLEKTFSMGCLLSTTLLDRAFFHRVGGLSTGFRFGADSEFVRRAVLGGRVINLPDILYHRRIHRQSLTHSEKTGFGSEQRKKVQKTIREAAVKLVNAVKADPDLEMKAIFTGEKAELHHLSGPVIQGL